MIDGEKTTSSGEGVGQMTRVMRGVSLPNATRALRIAMVQKGVVISEEVIERGAKVTIGATERSTFVVTEPALPAKYELFEATDRGYRLNLLGFMSGRIATSAGVIELDGVRSTLLGEDARGKVVVGEVTFLFQMVDAKPPKAKAPLGISFQKTLTSEIDWTTVIVAAVSFLLHFGVVASLYGDWVDPTVDDQVDVGALVEIVRTLPPQAVEKDDRPTPATVDTTTAKATTTTAPATGERSTKGSTSKPTVGGSGAAKGSGRTMGDTRATELSGQLQAANLEMIGVLSNHGRNTQGVLEESNVPTGLLEGAAKEGSGVGQGSVGLVMGGSGSGVVRPGGGHGGVGLTGIGDTHGGPMTAGSAIVTPRPPGQAQIGGAEPTGDIILDAPRVVAAMTPGLRRCYNTGITNEDPTMHGTLRLRLKIAPNGDVTSVTPSTSGNLSGSVVSCATARAASAHFKMGTEGGAGATLVVPVTFVQ